MPKPEVLDYMWDEPVKYRLQPSCNLANPITVTAPHISSTLAEYVMTIEEIKDAGHLFWEIDLIASQEIKEVISHHTPTGLAKLSSYPGNRDEGFAN